MTLELTPDVRQRLDAHLDAVEQALSAARKSRQQRRGIVDDLEAQIMDMLGGKSESPTLPDLEEVLAKLDPPSAYGEGSNRAAAAGPGMAAAPTTSPARMPVAARPRYSKVAIAGLICILLSLLPVSVLAVMAGLLGYQTRAMPMTPVVVPNAAPVPRVSVESSPRAPGDMSSPTSRPVLIVGPGIRTTSVPARPSWSMAACVLVLLGPLGLAGTVLGWIAFGQIRASHGMLRGTGLALFDGLFYPVLCVLMLALVPFMA